MAKFLLLLVWEKRSGLHLSSPFVRKVSRRDQTGPEADPQLFSISCWLISCRPLHTPEFIRETPTWNANKHWKRRPFGQPGPNIFTSTIFMTLLLRPFESRLLYELVSSLRMLNDDQTLLSWLGLDTGLIRPLGRSWRIYGEREIPTLPKLKLRRRWRWIFRQCFNFNTFEWLVVWIMYRDRYNQLKKFIENSNNKDFQDIENIDSDEKSEASIIDFFF